MAIVYHVKGNLIHPSTYLSQEQLQHQIILGHSTNALGIMGGGVALHIRNTFPNVYAEYVKYCQTQVNVETNNQKFKRILGSTQICDTHIVNLQIANMFGQYEIGTHKRQTNYEWLYQSLHSLFADVSLLTGNVVLAFPKYLGCGLGGGDWRIVEAMILAFAQDIAENVSVFIVEFIQ